jgi:RND family efflux transporter MFP subunit
MTNQPPRRRLLLTLLSTALAGGVVTTLAACERKSQAQTGAGKAAPAPTTVTVAPVKTLPVQRSVEVVGNLFGEEETVVSAKVPGRIIALYKDVGDTVAPGEPLVQLKQNDYQLAVTKAQLAMEEALAGLGLKELPPKDYDVTKVPTVVRAKLQWENAQAKLNRGKQLFEAQPPLMSEQEFSDLETANRVARAAYDVELLNARSLVAQAWALKGDVDIATQRLNDATTRAPSTPEATTQPVDTGRVPSGEHAYVVTHRYVNVGELVREITPAYRLVDINPIKLRAMVPERHVAAVKVGQQVKARVEAYPDVDFVGTVSRVNPQIEQGNRMFSIEAVIPNDDQRLRPGSFARASVQTHTDPAIAFVPEQAVVSFAGVNKVFIVKDGKAAEINVDPGDARAEDNKLVEIARGLKGGEQVVVTNMGKLATGAPVQVTNAPATTQSTVSAK